MGALPPQNTYEYSELQDGQIRILHLHPGEHLDSVFVEISHEDLRNDMPDHEKTAYNAMSWRWGDPSDTAVIRIKDKDRCDVSESGLTTCTLAVQKKLLAGLKGIRKTDRIVRLWVDAICIDQISADDEEGDKTRKNSEKSHQISMMTRIFGLAREVTVWLGEERDDSTKAIEFVDVLLQLEDDNHIAGLERSTFDGMNRHAAGLQPLINLLKREWFSRRWVVQEIAMAQKATLHCGDASIPWTKLADAVAILEKVGRDGTINRALKRLAETNHVPEHAGTISSLPAYRLVQTTTGIFRGQEEGFESRTWRFTLEELVCYLAAFRAGRLHDTIYAVLGLASDFQPVRENANRRYPVLSQQLTRRNTRGEWRRMEKQDFSVDYKKPPLLVFKEFLDAAIKNSKSLDILNRPWAPNEGFDAQGSRQTVELPSWIASLSRKPFQPTQDGRMVRFNPDPLVGPASFRQKFYTASLKTEARCHIDLRNAESTHMTVTGFVLDKIDETYGGSSFGSVPGEWLRAGGWEHGEGKSIPPPPSSLWRTLVGDRNSNGDDPDRWYPLVFQSVAKDRGLNYGFDTYRLITESTNATVAELFRRVQAVVWNRKLVHTEGQYMYWMTRKKGRKGLGLAPERARRGDFICIIHGCSVPLVLRQVDEQVHADPFAAARPADAEPAGAQFNGGVEPRSPVSEPTTPVVPMIDEMLSPAEPKSSNVGTFELIGEAYIDQMMDGEAMGYYSEVLSEKDRLRYFTLR